MPRYTVTRGVKKNGEKRTEKKIVESLGGAVHVESAGGSEVTALMWHGRREKKVTLLNSNLY